MKAKPVILVVDDQPQNIELLEAYLVPQGYEIVRAVNGEEALGKLSGNKIDLILLDVMMPGMDGFEVTRRIRQDEKNRQLPIILVTALRETENRVKGIEAGCDDFLSKPVDKTELLARVRSLLKVKAYNDLMGNYRKELEVTKKASDEALEYAESIINTVREPLITLDQDLRVVTVSRSFYEFFKVKPEETVGQLIYDLGNKQWDIPRLRELLETILPQKTTFDGYEVEHDFATIGSRIMLLNARQIQGVLGKERVILLAIEDITERKEIENSLKKAYEELEAFSYSVSHDLRAPLRGINGWSLALLEDYRDKLDEKGRGYIDLVRSETQIMSRLIDDLLMFSRQSRAEMNQQQLDMTAMAQAIVSRLQQQNPTLQADFIIQLGLRALGDASLIEIALKNLLDNALKFSSKNAHGRVEFGQVDQEGRRAFFVRDNGVGFDMAYSNKLFGVFRRLHKASEFPGTGIGLASVQRIINRHGGRIWAEAKVNEGATFYFTLKEAT
jgi:PAS domain S-box-containing protein